MPKFKRMPTQEELKREAEEWNNWKPGSGRKGWSPFNKPIPPARWYSPEGIPLKSDGTIDIEQWEKELAQKKGK